ncbi:hypothetical protein AVV44_gp165 [Cronobacter phage S13]|uniref:hypothetical protein n=1 Tax=Cronobacter phage S13 TaxID=1327935 RepID=UPI00049B07EF|nr:hypothetical protein AVV44_gp165 [Cronobacter phage S13]AIA64964.1 hypothetical protein S13_165 [Cronobacter phage S13]
MTDQEKADLELSIALIDQAVSSDSVTAANKDLKEAVNIEVDASLDLSSSKVDAKKAVDSETNVTNKSVDIIDDLNYSRSEQARAEKRYLNVLDRRLDIESKIGLTDYSKIDKELHRKLSEEIAKRIKAEQERNEKQKENDEEQEQEDKKQRKSDADYRREAEAMHKKRQSVFKRISDGHKNYMENSSSFTGRLAAGSLGKGTSELISLIDNVTDQIPGMKVAKSVGGFVRDQWRGSRENKRQNRIEKTAGFLKAKDVGEESEKAKQKDRDKDQKKGTEGILQTAGILGKIFGFLKKMSEMMMMMGIFKGIFSLMGSALSGLGGIITTAFTAALSSLGLGGLLSGLTAVLTSIAGKLGIKLPSTPKNPTNPNEKKPPVSTDAEKNKPSEIEKAKKTETKTPQENKKSPSKVPAEKATGNGMKKAATEAATKGAGTALTRGLAAGVRMVAGPAGTTYMLLEAFDAAETATMQRNMSPEEAERINKLREDAHDNYVDSTGLNTEVYDKMGNLQLYRDSENDPRKKAENEKRYRFAMDQQGKEFDQNELNQMVKAVDAANDAEKERYKGYFQANSALQSNIHNTTVNNQTKVNQLVGSPNERTKRDTDSRGVTR